MTNVSLKDTSPGHDMTLGGSTKSWGVWGESESESEGERQQDGWVDGWVR